MNRHMALAIIAFVLGVLITSISLAGGIAPSFALLLGLLLIADGLLRLISLPRRQ